jgi:hypothetical protein
MRTLDLVDGTAGHILANAVFATPDLPYVLLGTSLLWFGFNAGLALGATPPDRNPKTAPISRGDPETNPQKPA